MTRAPEKPANTTVIEGVPCGVEQVPGGIEAAIGLGVSEGWGGLG